MILPTEFDQNEWFVILGLIFGLFIIFLLPNRIPFSLVILIMLFSATTARLSDQLLARPQVDFYDIMDTEKYDLFDFLTYFLYAPFGYLFIYLYEKFQIREKKTFLYILLWSIFGTFFEAICTYFDVFQYKAWDIRYSFTVYLGLQSLTLLLYVLLKRSYNSFCKDEEI